MCIFENRSAPASEAAEHLAPATCRTPMVVSRPLHLGMLQENDLVSMFDRMTWSDARLKGMAAEDDKSETFVAQARTLLDSAEVRGKCCEVLCRHRNGRQVGLCARGRL